MNPCQYVPDPPHHVAGLERPPLTGYPSRKSANETPVPADEVGRCVMTPVKLKEPLWVRASVNKMFLWYMRPPNFMMCRPLIQVRLSVTSYSPRSCHFGRPSPALPENPEYPEKLKAGRLAIAGSWVASSPRTPA